LEFEENVKFGFMIDNCVALYLKVPVMFVNRVSIQLTNGNEVVPLMVYKKLGRLGKITLKPRAWWGYMNKWITSASKGFTGLYVTFHALNEGQDI